ncbi:MAG: phosphotransferase [Salinivirgaceae bacterium]|nr:phosphotransferase [Salinivirgaceae bacterium]
MNISIIKKLFKEYTGKTPEKVENLPLSGSDRMYVRMKTKEHVVLGAYNPHIKENEAYFSFTKHFKNFEIPVPEVLLISENKLYYLVEDLGEESLYDKVVACNGNLTNEVKELYKKSLKYLIKMQVSAGKSFDYTNCYPVQRFDDQAIQWDLNYFKYNFLKLTGVVFDEFLLEKDFQALKCFLLQIPMGSFMFRDFQSRNILIKDNEPWFIDFQGGREGPKSYDVASLLYQAKAQIPYETRKELFEFYFTELNKVLTVDYHKLLNSFKGFAVLRTLQVLGAYGFRGFYEKKPHFIESIPYALKNLKFLLLSGDFPIGVPHLKEIATKLTVPVPDEKSKNGLTIRISSFSYRKGIPADSSGNGGGFVFDCRGINNPGRHKEYQNLTGKDETVIDFFKQNSTIDNYLENIIKTIEPTINNYMERGFSNLSINFGCTGGQHRSVYCAENLSKYIQNNFNVNMVLWHREQGEYIEYDQKV